MSKSIPPVKPVPGNPGFNSAAQGQRQGGNLPQGDKDSVEWEKALDKVKQEGKKPSPDFKPS